MLPIRADSSLHLVLTVFMSVLACGRTAHVAASNGDQSADEARAPRAGAFVKIKCTDAAFPDELLQIWDDDHVEAAIRPNVHEQVNPGVVSGDLLTATGDDKSYTLTTYTGDRSLEIVLQVFGNFGKPGTTTRLDANLIYFSSMAIQNPGMVRQAKCDLTTPRS